MVEEIKSENPLWTGHLYAFQLCICENTYSHFSLRSDYPDQGNKMLVEYEAFIL
jgi:hypothetical protein